jgi:putative spermidine/putrescine transport system ATP-binding protein
MAIEVTVRPEKMVVAAAPSDRENRITGTVERRTYLGSLTQYTLESTDGRLLVMTQNRDHDALDEGAAVLIEWRREDCSYQC